MYLLGSPPRRVGRKIRAPPSSFYPFFLCARRPRTFFSLFSCASAIRTTKNSHRAEPPIEAPCVLYFVASLGSERTALYFSARPPLLLVFDNKTPFKLRQKTKATYPSQSLSFPLFFSFLFLLLTPLVLRSRTTSTDTTPPRGR